MPFGRVVLHMPNIDRLPFPRRIFDRQRFPKCCADSTWFAFPSMLLFPIAQLPSHHSLLVSSSVPPVSDKLTGSFPGAHPQNTFVSEAQQLERRDRGCLQRWSRKLQVFRAKPSASSGKVGGRSGGMTSQGAE